jgi:tRNA pseudouridine55 synthase
LHGLLLVDKPSGMTSHDVVQVIRRVARTRKVGHTGTLDPAATGLLPITIGHGTKLANYLTLEQKGYAFSLRLGERTSTDDAEGEVVETLPWEQVSADALAEAIPGFVGEQLQRPPNYSAIRVDGRRAYDRARSGEVFELEARPVTILSLELLATRLPEADLHMECTAGTYVRSLVRDLGVKLGTCATTIAIRRTRVGPFTLEQATPLDAITPDNIAALLLPPAAMLSSIAQLTLDAAGVNELSFGRAVPGADGLVEGEQVALLDAAGELIAVGEVRADGRVWPKRVLSARGNEG